MAIRTLRYAGSAVTVEYSDGRAAEIVEFLFGSLPPLPRETRPPLTGYSLLEGRSPGTLSLTANQNPIYEGADEGKLAEMLLSAVCHDLAERSRGGLLFHAGALEWRGKAVVLAGGVGAGKTTMSVWLAARGLRYRTDEMVFAPEEDLILSPFDRPLNLKKTSIAPLKEHFDFEGSIGRTLTTPAGELIPPSLLGADGPGGDLRPGLFLFPRYVEGDEPSFQALGKAQAGLELMKCLVNARNLPDHGLKVAARLGARAPACRLSYGSFDQIADRVDGLLQSL